jgi:uncharacterized protein (TIGR03067 family)
MRQRQGPAAVDIAVLDPTPEWLSRELRGVLDDEVERLPAKYREPFVLCQLEGKTNEQAAELLGCPVGTVCSRLARARARLRVRLTARDLAPHPPEVAPALDEHVPLTPVPAALATATGKSSGLFGARKPRTPALRGTAVGWAEAYLRGLFWAKLAKTALALLALIVVVGGLFFLVRPARETVNETVNDRDRLQGTWRAVAAGGIDAPNMGELRLVFTGDRSQMTLGGLPPVKAAFRLDSNRAPKAIDFQTDAAQIWPGIYDIEGKTLRICINHGGPDRPTDFRLLPGTQVVLYVFQRD